MWISPYEIVPADRDSADERVIAMARAGEVDAVLKGGLRTAELMKAAPRRGPGCAPSGA